MTVEPTTDPMEAAVQAVLASDMPPEDETPDPVETQEEVETEEEPVDDAETEAETASEDEAEEPEAPEKPRLFTVKVDGKEQQVTLEELTRDFSGRKSIDRRIQEAEIQRKQALDVLTAFQSDFQRLEAFAAEIQQVGVLQPPQPPDPKLAQTNVQAWAQAQAQYEAAKVAYQRQTAQRQYLAEQAKAVAAAQHHAVLQEQYQRMVEAIPELAKPETAKPARERMLRTATAEGFDPAEVEGITDARMVKILWKAARYDEMQERKTEARVVAPTQKPRSVPPAAAKRPDPMSEERKAYLALRKSGSVDDAVRVLMARGTPSR